MTPDKETKIHNLQQLKKVLLELNLEESNHIVINEFNLVRKNIYGAFSTDNAFIFVKEKSCHEFNYSLSIFGIINYISKIIGGGEPLISKKYYLIDFFSRTNISDKYDVSFEDGDIYEYNGNEYYIISLSKIIPASLLTNVLLDNICIIQDTINAFLADNPQFIEQVFFEEKSSNENESMLIKKLNPLKKKFNNM